MPTYEFRCANGHEFEEFHRRISDAPSTVTCPVCGAPAERRISGGAGLLFKGSGFYLTDYGKNAHRGESAKSGGDASKSEGGAKSDGGTKSDGGAASSGGSTSSSGSSSGGSSGGSAGGSTGGSSGAKGA